MKNSIEIIINKIVHKRELLVFVFLIIALLPYFYVSIYTNPIADDFTYAFKGKSESLLETLIGEYLNWNGRYTSNIFVLLNPIAFGNFIGYKIAPIFLIFALFFSLLFLLSTIMERKIKVLQRWAMSLVLTLLYLYQMPIISEGIYWYTGAITYQLGSVFFLIYLSFLILFLRKKFILKKRLIHLVILFLLIAITIGFNEIIMIVMFLLSVYIWVIFKLKKTKKQNALTLILICTVIFCSIVFFAPGNSGRESNFTINHQFFYSLFSSFAQTIRFSLDWVSSLPLILLSVLYYKVNEKLSTQLMIFSKSFYLTPIISVFTLFLLVFIGSFPAYWATGILGQHRTMNVSYLLFLLMWFVNLTVIYNRLKFPKIKELKYSKIIFYVLIYFSFIFTKNSYDLISDLKTHKCQDYNSQMQERYSIIKNSTDTAYFETMKNKPKTLFILDITDNPKNWQNKGYGIFFKKPQMQIMMKANCK